MKRWLILLPLSLIAADIVDIGVVTDREGIEIHKCHSNDVLLIEVFNVNREEKKHGSFVTTNVTLFLNDTPMTMIPTGTNIFRIRTLCAGSTSEVQAVRFVIRRPIPTPIVEKAERFPALPPSPPGMAAAMPLPGGRITSDYSEGRQRR